MPSELLLVEDDASKWSVGISRETIQVIIANGEDKGDMLGLWVFYAYTARWQNCNTARATTSYTATGLGWTEDRVRKVKKQLMELGLVDDKRTTGENGKVQGWYVVVRHLVKATLPKNHSVVSPDCGNSGDKCSRSEKGNAPGDNQNDLSFDEWQEVEVSGQLAIKSAFEKFWQAWPADRRVAKKQALEVFRKMNLIRCMPEILEAIERQQLSTKPSKFIPHPNRWLRDERWHDVSESKIDFSKGF